MSTLQSDRSELAVALQPAAAAVSYHPAAAGGPGPPVCPYDEIHFPGATEVLNQALAHLRKNCETKAPHGAPAALATLPAR